MIEKTQTEAEKNSTGQHTGVCEKPP